MRKNLIFLVFLFFLAVLSVHVVAFTGESKVLFIGEGMDAYTILNSYETNVLSRKEDGYDHGSLNVLFYDGNSVRRLSIKWYDYVLDFLIPYHTPLALGGYLILNILKPGFLMSWKRPIWFSKLKGYSVGRDGGLIRWAKEEGWEICEHKREEKAILDFVKAQSP